MRLIDADALIAEYDRVHVGEPGNARKLMQDAPTIEQPHWIPVTERMPEEKQDVLLAFKHNMAVGFYEDILHNGEPVWYANSGDGWMTGTESVDNDGIPTAWMPLPEPFEGGE